MVLADVNQGVHPDEIYSFIEPHVENIQTYWLEPEKTHGRMVAATIELYHNISEC